MAPRRLVPPSVRDTLLGIPSDTASLERNYVLADEDLELIATAGAPPIGSAWPSISPFSVTPAKTGLMTLTCPALS